MQFFKRYRMAICLRTTPVPVPILPEGYLWREWHDSDLQRHAQTKFRSFRDELDAEVFSCLGDYYGCLRLMSDISQQESFVGGATWLICYAGTTLPQDCATIQGIQMSEELGSIQNIGVVPEHRNLGLGKALVIQSLQGFMKTSVKRVVLEVTAQNLAAVNLYRSLGFRILRTMYRASPIDEAMM